MPNGRVVYPLKKVCPNNSCGPVYRKVPAIDAEVFASLLAEPSPFLEYIENPRAWSEKLAWDEAYARARAIGEAKLEWPWPRWEDYRVE